MKAMKLQINLSLFQTLDDTDGGHSLPYGPVLLSPKSVAEAIVEATVTGPQEQKAATLRSVLELYPMGAAQVSMEIVHAVSMPYPSMFYSIYAQTGRNFLAPSI